MQNLIATKGDPFLSSNPKELGMKHSRQRAWIEVQSSAIESNTQIMRGLIPESCLLMAVVKADGYGHGAATVATAALKGGANKLGVATCLLYTSPSPRDLSTSRMPSSA